MANERCPNCQGYRGLPRIVDMTSENPHECEDPFHKEAPAEESDEPEVVIEFPSKTPAAAAAPAQEQQQQVGNPVCPHCNEQGGVYGKMTRIGPFEVMVVCCRNPECRKILGVFQALQLQMMPPPQIN